MENASKALLMAAEVLLGVMILSIGVALFNSFSQYGKETAEKMQEKQLAEWNNNYLKYYGTITYTKNNNDVTEPIKVTAHDIVTVINMAKQNNTNYFEEGWEKDKSLKADDTTYYVQIDVGSEKNAERWKDDKINDFLKQNLFEKGTETKYYKVAEEPKISKVTGRVIQMEFKEWSN